MALVKIILFLLLWSWLGWKRADAVRNKQTFYFILLFLLLPQIIRLLCVIIYPGIFSTLDVGETIQAFGLGLRFDLSMLALIGGGCLLLINLPLTHLKYRRFVCLLCTLVSGFYALGLVADLVYFRYVSRHIGPDIYNFFLATRSVIGVALRSYWWLCVCIASGVALAIYLSQKYISREKAPCRGPWLYEVLFAGALVFFLWFAERGYFFTQAPVSPRQVYIENTTQGHLALNGVFNISFHLMPRHYIHNVKLWNDGHPSLQGIDEKQSIELAKQLLASPGEEYNAANFPLQRVRKQFSTSTRKKNLIILAIESLDFNSVDAVANTHHGATPHLDNLMRQGQIFDRFYACMDGSSLVGIGTTMSGVCWVAGAPYFSRGLEQTSQKGLGQLFVQAGYEAVFVRACEDKEMYIGPLARLMGFSRTYGREDMAKMTGKKAIYDGDALATLAAQFKQSQKPFLGFFFSTATHEPFETWSPKKVDASIEEKFEKQPYLRALAYTDFEVGKFIQFLKENHLYDDTAFVILGDHRRREISTTDKGQYQVPMALVAPGVLEPKRVHTVAGQTDILPTLVDLFHLQIPYAAMGKSLLADPEKDWTFVSQAGEDFAFVTPKGVISPSQPDTKHLEMLALNKAVYTVLKNNVWVVK